MADVADRRAEAIICFGVGGAGCGCVPCVFGEALGSFVAMAARSGVDPGGYGGSFVEYYRRFANLGGRRGVDRSDWLFAKSVDGPVAAQCSGDESAGVEVGTGVEHDVAGLLEDGRVGRGVLEDVTECKSPVIASVSGDCGVEVEVDLGANARTLANRKKRLCAKVRKARKKAGLGTSSLNWNADKEERLGNLCKDACNSREKPRGVQVDAESMELRKSLEAKWKAENELAMLKAQRQVQVLKANDVDGEIRRYRTNVVKQTERNMVQIEKVHGQLRSSGNVSDDMESRVRTVLDPPSLTSASISPDSSASQAEFRAAQKKILDLEAERARMLEQLKKLDITEDQLEMIDKETFTNNTVNNEYVERMYPHYYGASYNVVRDGVTKFKVGYDTTAQW